MSDDQTKPVSRVKLDIGDRSGTARAIQRQNAMLSGFTLNIQQIAAVNSNRIARIVPSGFQLALQRALEPSINVQQVNLADALKANRLYDNVYRIHEAIAPNIQAMNALSSQIQAIVLPLNNAIQDSVSRSLAVIDFTSIRDSLARRMPPNWPHHIKLEVAQRLVNEFGLPLVWVPGPTVISLLIEAPDADARRAVLLSHADVIVGDLRTCLDDMDGFAEVEDQVTLIRRAVDAFEAGHVEAGQALATVVLDALVMTYVGRHAEVPKKVKPLGDDTAFIHLISAAALSPLLLAYESFWPDRGDPIPVAFNRHATVHTSSSIQFTRANALIALMLSTSVVRTVRHYTEGDPADAA